MTEQEYAVVGKLVTYEKEKQAIEAELEELTAKIVLVARSSVGVYQSAATMTAIATRYETQCAYLSEVKLEISKLAPDPVVDPAAPVADPTPVEPAIVPAEEPGTDPNADPNSGGA